MLRTTRSDESIDEKAPSPLENKVSDSPGESDLPPGAYLLHHVNNQLAVLDGNLSYILSTLDQLRDVRTKNPENKRRLERIHASLRKTVEPMKESVKTVYDVTRTVARLVGETDR